MKYYVKHFPGRLSFLSFFLSFIGFRFLEGYGDNLAFTTSVFLIIGSLFLVVAGIMLAVFAIGDLE